jgi:biopolymer transport protein TolR
MLRPGDRRNLVSEINVTPFVDVMLVLLIIFMVAAPMMTQGIDVDLPETQSVESLPTDNQNMILSLQADGTIYLDEYRVPFDELEAKVELLVKEQRKQLFLKADKDVPYGTVMAIMGRIKAAGIEKLGMVAQHISDDEVRIPPVDSAAPGTDAASDVNKQP